MKIKNIYDIAGRAMAAQMVRLNTIASNLANAGSATGEPNTAYKPLKPEFKTEYSDNIKKNGVATVNVEKVIELKREPIKTYMPSHTEANQEGYIFKAPIINSTIPHELKIKYGSVRLILKPASPGTGIIAGGAVRQVLELVGITNILSKVTGSSNPVNVVKAVQKGLMELRDPLMVARDRGINLKQLFS